MPPKVREVEDRPPTRQQWRRPERAVGAAPRATQTDRRTSAKKENGNLGDIPTIPYTLFSNMAPMDFFLFPKIKTSLKGDRFGTIETIQRAVTRALNEVPRPS
ncbi:hypothetical protein AAG570_004871 [Ranatra chinensis]|uniref:Uncharacterized protein n=1 Tax=Ranatra chinensis TaxID=642074 RepID=A0ABD0XZP4_9HEMI